LVLKIFRGGEIVAGKSSKTTVVAARIPLTIDAQMKRLIKAGNKTPNIVINEALEAFLTQRLGGDVAA